MHPCFGLQAPGYWLSAGQDQWRQKISLYSVLSGDTSFIFHRFHRGSSNFDQIRMDCLRRGQMFEDPDFPASDASVYYSCNPPLRLEWKRPAVGSFSLHLRPYLNINLGWKVLEMVAMVAYMLTPKQPMSLVIKMKNMK